MMAESIPEKPLPSLPTQPLTTLSSQSRAHRGRFIRRVLSDTFSLDPGGWVEDWARVIEDALDDVSLAIAREDWFKGVRKRLDEKRKRSKHQRGHPVSMLMKPTHTPPPQQGTSSTSTSSSLASTLPGHTSIASSSSDTENPRSVANSSETHHDQDQDQTPDILSQIRKFTSTKTSLPPLPEGPDPGGTKNVVNHLVLCVAPFGSGTTHVSSGSTSPQPSCVYMPGMFSVSVSKAPPGVAGDHNTTILYGLNDWESSISLSQSPESDLRVVGGTFVLLGITSPQHHQSLITVLRASIYLHLSLILDQHLYSDSGIKLKYPRPPTNSPIQKQSEDKPIPDNHEITTSTSPSGGGGIRSSLFNFFSKRAVSAFSHRSSTISSGSPVIQQQQYPSGGRNLSRNRTMIQVPRNSTVAAASPTTTSSPIDDSSRSSLDSIGRRIRRFSLRGSDTGGKRNWKKKALPDIDKHDDDGEGGDPNKPYSSALKRIEKSRDILSTSFDVVVPVPDVLVRLAKVEKEERDDVSSKRLRGKEKCLLTTLLGWEDASSSSKGMVGLMGFVRHQGLSVLVSRSVTRKESSALETPSRMGVVTHIRTSEPEGGLEDGKELDAKGVGEAKDAKVEVVKLDGKSDAKTSAGTTMKSSSRTHNPCGRPRWITFGYYSKPSSSRDNYDPTLGEVIQDLSAAFSLPCEEPGCHYKYGEHQLKLVHDGVKVDVSLSTSTEEKEKGKEGSAIPVKMWESCAVCGKKSKVREMSDGTFLLSFAKYLELLIYSSIIHSSSICEHTNTEHQSDRKFNIIRHFSASETCILTFTLSQVKDIFELHLPRLQTSLSSTDNKDKTYHPLCPDSENPDHDIGLLEEDKTKLRREIKSFWEVVSDYLDNIEEVLSSPDGDAIKKALPRLPSATDEVYEDMFSAQTSSTISTYLTTSSSLLNGYSMMDPVVVRVSRGDHQHPSQASGSTMTTMATGDEPLLLLASMRYSFQRTEQLLYGQLAQTPVTLINDVKRSFLAAGRGAEKRITAWKKKHSSLLSKADQRGLLGELKPLEPEWWDKKHHPLPGGYVMVQEDDLGSIIAFTLSSADFLMELSNASLHRSASCTNLPSGTLGNPDLPSLSQPQTPSANSATTTKGYKFFSQQQQQPDPDKEGVVWHETESCAAVVTRKENSRDSASLLSIRDMLRSRTPVEPGGTLTSSKSVSPPSALSKLADAQLNKEEVGGKVAGPPQDLLETAGKVLQGIEAISSHMKASNATSTSSSSLSSSKREREQGNDKDTEKDGDRDKLPSLYSTALSSVSDVTIGMLPSSPPPEVPPKDYPSSTCVSPPFGGGQKQQQQQQASTSFANTLTNSLSYALRLVSSGASTPRGGGSGTAAALAKSHHGLLLTDGNVVEERPHVKYEVMVGKRLRLACTVYYARQFDLLRKRCGVDDIFVKSLSHSANWAAEGGKSRANFWKTSDDRFVIKTLVNAWNVADLHVLLELGPSYFRYMESTVSKPTVLVKILGVYTVEVKNSESGTTSKVDLVVMENLFYNRKVDKTFDLKGIQGRKVKPSATDVHEGHRRQTLFDGEWIEGQQRALMLVRPEWKKVLREAVKSDGDFLAKMNIMDYSLLLGIDLESKQLTCGLVDTIGSYTFAKTLEYKAKHGLQSGKDITVIPPAEYEERFVNAMEGYFVACPDKWSKPLDGRRILHSVDQLPSVL